MKKQSQTSKNHKQLAKWIRKGWHLKELKKFHRVAKNDLVFFLDVEKYSIYFYTLFFAFWGKVGKHQTGKLREFAKSIYHSKDPFEEVSKFFGVTKSDMRKLTYLDGPFSQKTVLDIAEMMESGEFENWEKPKVGGKNELSLRVFSVSRPPTW